jgi:hypothetical protein
MALWALGRKRFPGLNGRRWACLFQPKLCCNRQTQDYILPFEIRTRTAHPNAPQSHIETEIDTIDVFTRTTTDFHLSMDWPSRLSVSLRIFHAV